MGQRRDIPGALVLVSAHSLVCGLLAAVTCGALAAALAGCGGSTAGASSPRKRDSASDGKEPLAVHVAPGGATAVLVPVYINGRGPFRFTLGTGASRSIADHRLARKLAFRRDYSHRVLMLRPRRAGYL
jgi:hypothetical protein